MVKHIFTDAELSLSWKTDSPEAVRKNWIKLKKKLGLRSLKIAYLSQVHGKRIVKVEKHGFQGPGDGLYTEKENVALVIFTADCFPVLFEERQKIAALHCGWRSVRAGIIEDLAEILDFSETTAYIGPGIGACCFEVGREFLKIFPDEIGLFQERDNRLFFDLKGLIIKKLKKLGIRRIVDESVCTKCSPLFFSHRRGDRKRQVGLIIKLSRSAL